MSAPPIFITRQNQSSAPLMSTLRRVFVEIDLFGHRNHFAVTIVTTCAAYVVWAFQLTAVGAFKVRGRGQAVVRPAHTTLRPCNLTLRYRHFSDLCSYRACRRLGPTYKIARWRLIYRTVGNETRNIRKLRIAASPPVSVFRLIRPDRTLSVMQGAERPLLHGAKYGTIIPRQFADTGAFPTNRPHPSPSSMPRARRRA